VRLIKPTLTIPFGLLQQPTPRENTTPSQRQTTVLHQHLTNASSASNLILNMSCHSVITGIQPPPLLRKSLMRAFSSRYVGQINDSQYLILNTFTNTVNMCRIPEFRPNRQLSTIHHASPVNHAPFVTLKTLRAALCTPDAAEWAVAYDQELDRHSKQLGTWRLESRWPGDTPRWPLLKFTQKTNADGTASRKKVRRAIRGDTMTPGVEYSPDETSAQTPSHTSLRLLVALSAATGAAMESWDVPGAYPQADADPNYRQTMIQPPPQQWDA
jgi:hypothetical protein